MVFPGVLRGRPGPRLATTPTNRPRRSLSSPGMLYRTILAVGRGRLHGRSARYGSRRARSSSNCRAGAHGPRQPARSTELELEGRRKRPAPGQKTTRSRVALRNLLGHTRRATSLVARPHTSLASLFASRFRVWIQGTSEDETMQQASARRVRTLGERRCPRPPLRRTFPGAARMAAPVRPRLAALPQWRHGK